MFPDSTLSLSLHWGRFLETTRKFHVEYILRKFLRLHEGFFCFYMKAFKAFSEESFETVCEVFFLPWGRFRDPTLSLSFHWGRFRDYMKPFSLLKKFLRLYRKSFCTEEGFETVHEVYSALRFLDYTWWCSLHWWRFPDFTRSCSLHWWINFM